MFLVVILIMVGYLSSVNLEVKLTRSSLQWYLLVINLREQSLHQNRITLDAKNRQGKQQNRQGNYPWRLAAKQNPPRIESQENQISLAASCQGLFFWRFGRQVKQTCTKIANEPIKFYSRQGYNFSWRPLTAKDVTFLGSHRQPKKVIYLAGINRQGNAYRQQKKYNRH